MDLEKYTDEQLREALCARFDRMPCDKKPDGHNCNYTCWLHKDKQRAELNYLLSGEIEFLKAYFEGEGS